MPDGAYYRELEVRSRRSGAPHPDQCPKLAIHGAEWSIPPRGTRVVPQFHDDGTITAQAAGGDECPEADAFVDAIPVVDDETCPECGSVLSASIEVDVERGSDFLAVAFKLAATLLRRQYELSNEQLADLLGYTGVAPVWISQLASWCHGVHGVAAWLGS